MTKPKVCFANRDLEIYSNVTTVHLDFRLHMRRPNRSLSAFV